MKKTWIIAAAAAGLAMLAAVPQLAPVGTAARPAAAKPEIGYLAPPFELETLDGGRLGIALGERERPVVLNFWASWCDPCRLEAPILAGLHEKYGDRLDIYGVNGTNNDDLNSVRAFVKLYGYKFPTLLDRKGEVFDKYRLLGYPTSFLIDRHGVIRDMIVGLPGYAEFERRVLALMKY